MINAKLYNDYNQVQVRDAIEVIDRFNCVAKVSGEKCILMDIGTGCGEVLSTIIVKNIEIPICKAIGVDISKEMIEFAKNKYANQVVNFFNFDVFDNVAKTEVNTGVELGMFDVVSCFYCLHWIKNLR